MADDRVQARCEAAALLGVDIEHLSAADGLRVDMISALRLVIDHEQAAVLDGAAADLGKLNVAVASLIALLPNRELPSSPSHREDPRARLLELILQMRERDGVPDEGTTQATIDEQAAEIEQLRAEVAALKAGGAGKPEDSDVPTVVERVPAPAAKVVPLPRAAAPAPAAKASPSYDYDRERGWRDHVQPDGSISPTPFGGGRKWWGPV
jgi:hypothetical protein